MTSTHASAPATDAGQLHRDLIIIDGLASSRLPREHLQRIVDAGVTAINYTVVRPANGFAAALAEIAATLEIIAANSDLVLQVRTVADIHRAKAEGKVGLILGLQNAKLIEDDLSRLRILHELGVRIIQLTYNARNYIGDGCVETANGGLSHLGRRVIAEMERLGILLDLSHCGQQTTLDALHACERPPVFSHANAYEIFDSPRNKTREALLLLAEKGGLVGPNLWSPMLRRDRQPDFDDFMNHLNYLVELLGVEHVGFATDHSEGSDPVAWEGMFGRSGKHSGVTGSMGPWYGYETRYVQGYASVSSVPQVTAELLARGYTAEAIEGIMGTNVLRVYEAVWGA